MRAIIPIVEEGTIVAGFKAPPSTRLRGLVWMRRVIRFRVMLRIRRSVILSVLTPEALRVLMIVGHVWVDRFVPGPALASSCSGD